MTFDKKEKKEIEETLSVVLKDLRKLYESSSTEELSTSFSIPGDYGSAYNLCVKKSIICFCRQDDTSRYVLERKNSIISNPKIKDYESIYGLLEQYEKIRKELENQALESAYDKEMISKKLKELRDKYSHETTVEIDLAETNNQRVIDIREEDGTSIGEIKFGRDTIRLITKGSIVINDNRQQVKVKRK